MRAPAHGWARAAAAAVTLCALALGGAGCAGDDDDGEAPLHTRCDLAHDGRELAGEWTLTARGTRSRCESRAFEGDLVLETSMPIDVAVDPQSSDGTDSAPTPDAIADAFVQRIERAEFVLGLAAGAPAELSFSGGTVGSCMSATLVEDLGGDDALLYELDGAITDEGYAEGDFTGEGPAGCRVDGTFELIIR
jgi:hypothetical protein